jgi:trans-2,3-dihydro-3-hydroxyanthranilate isomerase
MRRFRFVQVDVFTRRAFGGNQLAVLTEAEGLSDDQLQDIAREMNFSETTFVLPPGDPSAAARVRIFTPAIELPFAGHPVVGTGYVLGVERNLAELRLELRVGTLGVRVEPGDGRAGAAWMEQPVPRFRPAGADAAVLAGLVGVAPEQVGPSPAEFGSAGNEFLYLPLRSLDAVRHAAGDGAAIRRFFGADHHHPAIYLFSLEAESPGAVAHARMFSLVLGAGVHEDPATGSAAGPFGAYLVRHGLAGPGRLVVEQGYEMRRPSLLEIEVDAAGGQVEAVRVGGGVVRVAEGELLV